MHPQRALMMTFNAINARSASWLMLMGAVISLNASTICVLFSCAPQRDLRWFATLQPMTEDKVFPCWVKKEKKSEIKCDALLILYSGEICSCTNVYFILKTNCILPLLLLNGANLNDGFFVQKGGADARGPRWCVDWLTGWLTGDHTWVSQPAGPVCCRMLLLLGCRAKKRRGWLAGWAV